MKKTSVFSLLTFLLLFVFFACNEESLLNQPDATQDELVFQSSGQSSEHCFNFKFEAEGLPIGCACIPPVPLECPVGESTFCAFGAKTFPITIGEYEGYMTSVVIDMNQMGNGALKLVLHHYFVTEDGNSAFWTDDQVVCAPVGTDPSTCLVNDVLDIAGGCGDFEGAYGKFHNHGLLSFDGGIEPCGEFQVPTGTVDAQMHGRVCAPGL